MSISVPLEGNAPPSFKLTRPPGQTTGIQWRATSFVCNVPGYRVPAMPGAYSTYRRIWANPTVAFVHAATRAVMKTPDWSVEADDDVPDEVVEYLERAFIKHKAAILNHGSTGRIFGRASWEKVWERDEDGYLFPRLKPLVADITVPMVDKDTGRFVGLKQSEGGAFLGRTKCHHYAYDGEAEDPYGRSVLENIRTTAWRAWEDTREKLAQYTTKSAGVIPVVQMPPGVGEGPDGETSSNQKHADTLIGTLGGGAGIVMPMAWSNEIAGIVASEPKLIDAFRWNVSFLEVAAGHGSEFLDMLKQEETRMVRGMLWPERALTEGQFGTKAESGVQMDIGLLICEQDTREFVEDFNRDVVDDALEANWGAMYKGKARIKMGPLRDTEKEFFRGLLQQLILNPTALEVASQIIDVDGMLDANGFPKAKNIVTVPALLAPGGAQNAHNPQNPGSGAPGEPPAPGAASDPEPPKAPPAPIKASRIDLPASAVPPSEPTPEQEEAVRGTVMGTIRRWLRR